MCVEFVGKWRVAEEDMFAYKVVKQDSDGLLCSQVFIGMRSPQEGSDGRYHAGCIAYYELDVMMTDDDGFGFYLHTKKPTTADSRHAVLKIRIPKGSEYRRARGSKMNARTIVPFEIVKDIEVPQLCPDCGW